MISEMFRPLSLSYRRTYPSKNPARAASPFLGTTPLSEFHLFQTDQRQDLNLRTQSLVEQSESQEEKQHEILSEMRSSGSSILVWSMSHDARLRDIQSLCSKLSDRMDTVLSRLSSRSSRASSQVGEIGDLIPRVLETHW